MSATPDTEPPAHAVVEKVALAAYPLRHAVGQRLQHSDGWWEVARVVAWADEAAIHLTPFWLARGQDSTPAPGATFLADLSRYRGADAARPQVRRRLIAAARRGGVQDLPGAMLGPVRAALDDVDDPPLQPLRAHVSREVAFAAGCLSRSLPADPRTRRSWEMTHLPVGEYPSLRRFQEETISVSSDVPWPQTGLSLSPEQLADIRRWDAHALDETTRREVEAAGSGSAADPGLAELAGALVDMGVTPEEAEAVARTSSAERIRGLRADRIVIDVQELDPAALEAIRNGFGNQPARGSPLITMPEGMTVTRADQPHREVVMAAARAAFRGALGTLQELHGAVLDFESNQPGLMLCHVTVPGGPVLTVRVEEAGGPPAPPPQRVVDV